MPTKRKKEISVDVDNFKGGLHTLISPTKIKETELAQADNIILVDEGSPSRRWGTQTYSDDSSGSIVTLFATYKDSTGDEELIKIENGLGKKLNQITGAWSLISGASFTSTQIASHAQLGNTMYISNGVDSLTKYDGSGFTRFTQISAPTGVGIARGASLVSGTTTISYKVTALTDVGETDASTAGTEQVDRERDQWNFDPNTPDANYSVTVSWNKVTGATGYNIYGVESGFETYLARVSGEDNLTWIDYGTVTPSTLYDAPTANTTDAPKGKYIKAYKSALLIAGDPNSPNRLYFSAGVDRPEDFSIGSGGGFAEISATDVDGDIKGIGLFQSGAVILKRNSVWNFGFTDSGIPSVTNISRGLGCVSHRSVKQIENDLFFVGRKPGKGYSIYVLGNEPNFTVLRTNELSARVRPELETINEDREDWITSDYLDGKYIVSYSDGNSELNDTAIVYDRERLAFTKWLNIGIEDFALFTDSDNKERKLFIDNQDYRVAELDENIATDRGAAINWYFRTKQFDGKTPFLQKHLGWTNFRIRDGKGSLKFSFFTDNSQQDYTLDIAADYSSTTLGGTRFRATRFRVSTNQSIDISDNVINQRFPMHRLGQDAVGRSHGFGIRGMATTSKATLLNLSFRMKERSEKYTQLNEVYQI